MTFNICIGRSDDLEGSELLFGADKRSASGHSRRVHVDHALGTAVVHRGCLSHEVAGISSGSRSNLLMWCRSIRQRQLVCAMCGHQPRSSADLQYSSA